MSALDPDWHTFWAECRSVDIMDVWARLGAPTHLKKQGREWVGPCAFCGGKDRFSINPERNVFNCRGAEGGGPLEMVVHVWSASNVSSVEAAEFIVGRDRPGAKREESEDERRERQAKQQEWREAAEHRRKAQEREDAERRRRDEEACDSLIKRAVRIEGTHAEAYLRTRGATASRRLLGDLRFVPDADYWGFASATSDRLEHIATLPLMLAIPRDVNGVPAGAHQTYLHPDRPEKWIAPWEVDVEPKKRKNPSKKMRKSGETLTGSMIRLGLLGDKLAIGEGIESVLGWHAMGYGPEDVSLAAALDLSNLAGGCTGALPHPTKVKPDGKPYRIGNGIPAPEKPGVLLPEWVREVIILGDGDSDIYYTRGLLMAQVRRWRAQGRIVSVHMAPAGMDWADMRQAQIKVHAEAEAKRREAAA